MGEVVEFRSPRHGELMNITMDEFFAVLMGSKSLHDIAWERRHREVIAQLESYDIPTLRRMWDEIGDDSFYTGPEGSFDCADIHRVMNAKGDGVYCAV